MARNEQDTTRILVVDGDEVRRTRTADALESLLAGVEARSAVDAAAASAMLRADPVDCIVSANRLPEADGLAFLEDVRREYGDVPFVLFPEDGSEALASRAVQHGVTEYVPRGPPAERFDRLAACVERAVDDYRSTGQPPEDTTSRGLFDALTDPAFLHDTDGSFLAVNETACAQFGYTESELLAMGPETLAVPEHARRHPKHIAELEREETMRFDAVLQRADGTGVPVEVNARWLEYYGEPAILATARGITDRKERERTLRSFREAVENAGHAIYITDADGTIEYVNAAFEETTGFAADEAIGRNPRILQSGEHDEQYYEDLWSTILRGDVWEGEVVNERADGERFVVDQTVAPVTDGDGDVERFVAINTDVTERKERERELRRTNERLEEFASVVSHDLRNPLGVARGRVHLAMEDCDSEHLADLRDALERMDAIVDDVLSLAREGAADVDSEPVALGDVARSCWSTVATDDADLVLEDPPVVEADRGRLQQLLENLFRNAVEHGSTGPERAPDVVEHGSTGIRSQPSEDPVTIRVGPLDDAGTDRGDDGGREGTASGFYVADDGPGIPPGERDAVFDHGYSTDDDGTGFGLSIVEAIAEAHGWQVVVEQSRSGGARFAVREVDADRPR
jgi:PAS domain S-box-containing protein